MHLQEYPGECARALTQSVDLSHVFTLLRVDKFVIWEEFTRPWNWKIGKTGYQKNSSETTLGGGEAIAPPPYGSATGVVYYRKLAWDWDVQSVE